MEQELLEMKRIQQDGVSSHSPSIISSPHLASSNDQHTKLASKYWKRYDGFVSAQTLSVADGIRLLSFDYLFRRSIQYHSTNHSFHPNDWFQIQSQTQAVDPDECVVEMQTFQFGSSSFTSRAC